MKFFPGRFAIVIVALINLDAFAAIVHYVDLNSANATPPYTDWSTAATNIQDAIDVSLDGDQIFVTNGIYRTGGKVMAGDLANRVALDKPVTVQSVNGPWVTIIQGIGPGAGPSFVRCAWLTNGASLTGFTLKWGGTRAAGDTVTLQTGGGVWCASSNAIVANCVIATNAAYYQGAGVFRGTINNSLIRANELSSSVSSGYAVYGANLNNCTITDNSSVSPSAYAVYLSHLTNCIVYSNVGNNYTSAGSIFSYCCTTPMPPGIGNFIAAPQLFADGIHLLAESPCVGKGTNRTTGTDLFGYPWANPPSVGCAEWSSLPLASPPQVKLTSDPVGFTVTSTSFAGQPPFSFQWLRSGSLIPDDGHFSSTQTTNLTAIGVSFSDAGGYQIIVSNTFGVSTSAVAQLVVHCVDVAGANSAAPYSTWVTAATNIQDAIAASSAGEVVLVTNGLYSTGGKSMDGVITNRVAVDKAILMQSVNGADATVIQGAWDPTSTSGLGAVRCVWMTNSSVISGFTLRGGATRALSSPISEWMNGGGVWGAISNKTPNATVANCLIVNNSASCYGGGAYNVVLNNCVVATNTALGGISSYGSGGGAHGCNLRNCLVIGNFASLSGAGVNNCNLRNCAITQNRGGNVVTTGAYGGGANSSTLINCTVTFNALRNGTGGGVASSTVSNTIVYGNTVPTALPDGGSNAYNSTITYSCVPPFTGTGNIVADPLLLPDGIHLSASSPCIGAGTGTNLFPDIDGQSWNRPPSMGCDEWQPAPAVAFPPTLRVGTPARGLTFNIVAAGQSPFSYFWSKDGALIQDDGHYGDSSSAAMVVNNFGTDDAGTYQVIVSNAFGVVTSAVTQVIIHAVSAAGVNPVAPYSNWATAATNIQDAIESASAGEIVLVTNGVYATGGKTPPGDLMSRIVLDKPLTVISVNGFSGTIIQGTWDPATTNGPLAVRCAWLSDGANLNGFTLRNGATQKSSGPIWAACGGGVFCASTNSIVSNCLLTNNDAVYGGGIAYGALNNSIVVNNIATRYGGGAYYSTLNNCTVANNAVLSPFGGGGTYDGVTRNSIVIGNNFVFGSPTTDNYTAAMGTTLAKYLYCCTSPNKSGTGNINVNPQFLDDSFHISVNSPCRGRGSSLYALGTDLDSESWANPPSMGYDEVIESNLTGPLSIASLWAYQTNVFVNRSIPFSGFISGRASRVEWSFGDGPAITNVGAATGHQWTNSGDYTVTFTAFNNDNPNGVSTNLTIHVQPLNVPQLQSAIVLTNGFQFQFPGQTNADYVVQYATNLASPVSWMTLQNIYFSPGGMHQILDPTLPTGTRFYRVLAR